uniref:Uncharacterized protein n=1 Tax=Tetranychus urticae TaxID=32264 RepID=T1KT10_TETUR
MSSTGRGALIVIEGIDRVGKSTLCERLRSTLASNNKNIELMRFPFPNNVTK